MTNDQRDQMISETHDTVARLEERSQNDRDLLGKVATTLYGNGKIGLCSKVHLLMWVLGLSAAVVVAALGTYASKVIAGS